MKSTLLGCHHKNSYRTQATFLGHGNGTDEIGYSPWGRNYLQIVKVIKMTCLCIGPSGSGKTLLLKRLQAASVNEGTSTVETVGSNIVKIPKKLPSPLEKVKPMKNWEDSEIMGVREIGGSISPLWPSYFSPDKLIMFVIDSSNLFQVSITTVLLMELLSHEKLIGAKMLIILTKSDLTDRKKMNYLKFMMRLDTIVSQAGKRVSVAEVSTTSGDGIEDVRKWLVDNWPKVKKSKVNVNSSTANSQ